ncbi:WecB/TagA/CpsF family glycosyltransferase [Sulfobacillus thermosulfidooxidans]|uniref:WecB/TagA/CpsF family glycosyltransferase n=1 Tax=Sulfobacillus thermosulfidooxidans TaxID=28034 RepID=UPI0002F73C6C|nr:WecB/TagA/CpsF family glycosyltransferase [Sulfobacillus thermosulfidooxidans]
MRQRVLGCPVDDCDLTELLNQVREYMAQGIKHWYTSINVANWYAYTHFPDVAALFDKATFITADGWPIAWASRVIHHAPLPRIPAMNFLEALLSEPWTTPLSVFLLGGKPGIAEQAGEHLTKKYAHIRVVGHFHGYFDSAQEEGKALQAIQKTQPSVLILGMGTPYEQAWLSRHFAEIPSVLAVGIGGGMDILAGIKKRAPQWMQNSGMEWLYRLIQEPRRLSGRYVKTTSSFAWHVFRVFWRLPSLSSHRANSYSEKKGA